MAFCATDGNVRCFENEQKRKIAQNVQRRYGRLLGLESVDVQQNQKLTITEAGGISAAVLTAIAIPVFTSQLEKSREATDAANIRSAYAVIQSAALVQDDATTLAKNNTADATFTVSGTEGSLVYTATVKLKQQQDEWQSGAQDIGGVSLAADTAKKLGTATITYTQSTNTTTITIA